MGEELQKKNSATVSQIEIRKTHGEKTGFVERSHSGWVKEENPQKRWQRLNQFESNNLLRTLAIFVQNVCN